MKKIMGLTVALVVLLGIAFNLNIKADSLDGESEQILLHDYSDTKENHIEESDLNEVDTTETYEFAEMDLVNSKIDTESLHTDLVEDNPYKRVLLWKDDQGEKQYKTIYLKKQNFLKVIDLHGGLVYKGNI